VNPRLDLPNYAVLRNLNLSLATSSDDQIFNTTSISSFDCENCTLSGYGSNPLPVIDVKLSAVNASVVFRNCKTFGGVTVGTTGASGTVNVSNNKINNGYTSVHGSSGTIVKIDGNICNNGMINVNAVNSIFASTNITNNIIRGSDTYNCDIQIWTNITDTIVRNLIISNNTLCWSGTRSETILISPWAYGGGSFFNWQDVYVEGNTVNSDYEDPTTYPNVGTIYGPYASSTHGTDIVLFDEFIVSAGSNPAEVTNTKIVRIGPMFLGSESQSKTFNSHISSISGEIYAQQIGDINSDGVKIHSAHFYLGVSNADPITGGRFYEARAEVKHVCLSGNSTFWARPRAIITWGDRAQIGKYSKVY